MNRESSPEPSASSTFEDFLAGKQTDNLAPTEPGIVVPPRAEDDKGIEQIVANIRAELTHQLRSEATEVLPAGMTVRTYGNVGETIYQPDLIVDADLPPPGALSARNPQVVFEVAAGGSERSAFIEQWQIYRSLPSLRVYVLVNASQLAVTLHRRAGETWKTETFGDADDQLFLPTIHCLLSLEAVYAGVFSEKES